MNEPIKTVVRDIISKNLQNIVINEVNIEPDHTGGYSCKVLPIRVEIENRIGTEILQLILKYLPIDTTETLKLSFVKEVLVYKLLIPEYNRVQNQLNIDVPARLNIFPNFVGDNLNNEIMSAFLMRDLKQDGYITAEFITELDMNHTKLVIEKMAYFHALGIKLKEKPQIFENEFKELLRPALRNMNNPNKTKIDNEFIEKIKKILTDNPRLEKFTENVVELIKRINIIPLPDSKEPFATVLHNDLWKNNLLFKYDAKGSLTDVKLIDFQFVVYNSPVRDLIYFIYTSTSNDVQSNYKDISEYYYVNFIKYLTLLNYTDLSLFNIDAYNEEIKQFGWTKFKHILMTILLICNDNDRDEKLFNLITSFLSNGWM